MLSFPHERGHFNYRVAGVCIQEGRLLLHTSDRDDFWSLPGGRCEFGETSKETLVREMKEELGEEIVPGRLRWMVENFFHYNEQLYHELAFYYAFSLSPGSSPGRKQEWSGFDGGLELTFRWFRRDELEGLDVYPSFVPSYAFDTQEAGPLHIVWKE